MNGVHDLGGMHGFGPIVREEPEPVFHAAWERRAFALTISTMAARCFNVDEFRRTIERMPPAQYLSASYYERWLHSTETMLVEKGIITLDELEAAMRDRLEVGARPRASMTPVASRVVEKEPGRRPRFRPGQRVRAKNINPPGHTRLPRYARSKRGIVRHDWGVFALPDSHAHGMGRNLQHCYGVEFEVRELWGRDHTARERICLDLWEDYLEADRGGNNGTKKAVVSAASKTVKRKPASKKRVTPKARRRTGTRRESMK